jgi:FlaA1/EpsC-like NDP-sugar epimerase
VIPIWLKQIEKGEPLTITHPDMKRYFMTIDRACRLVLEAVKLSEGGEIFILDMGEQLKIGDIADMIIKKSGSGIKKEVIGTRPGEKFEESLMTEEESKRAKKVGDLYIIK